MAEDLNKVPENTEEPLDFGKKKKKKKDKAELLKEVEATASAKPADETAQKLQDLKISETPTPAADTTATTTTTEAAATTVADDEQLDFSKMKKTKKPKVTFDERGEVEFAPPKIDQQTLNNKDSQGSWQDSERDYTYDELLKRVFDIMEEKNPGATSGEKKKFIMKPPQVARVGTKKTSFTNFGDICRLLKRQEKHLLNFLLAELGTTGSLDINNQLIIKGRFQQKQIETVLRRYIKEYITCHTCRSPDTTLVKEERIFFLQCDACGSRCAVASIKSGFQAQVVKRAAQRAKAT